MVVRRRFGRMLLKQFVTFLPGVQEYIVVCSRRYVIYSQDNVDNCFRSYGPGTATVWYLKSINGYTIHTCLIVFI